MITIKNKTYILSGLISLILLIGCKAKKVQLITSRKCKVIEIEGTLKLDDNNDNVKEFINNETENFAFLLVKQSNQYQGTKSSYILGKIISDSIYLYSDSDYRFVKKLKESKIPKLLQKNLMKTYFCENENPSRISYYYILKNKQKTISLSSYVQFELIPNKFMTELNDFEFINQLGNKW